MRTGLSFSHLTLFALACAGTLLLVSACGGETTPPPNPPRTLLHGPPPAWAETKGGSVWLAYNSYCWPRTGCVDTSGPAGCSASFTLVTRPGTTVRFHLRLHPKSVSVTVGRRTEHLKPSRTPTWTAVQGSSMSLTVGTDSGHVSYSACLGGGLV
jgi:hypothetical protein